MTLVDVTVAFIVGLLLVTSLATAYEAAITVWRPNGAGAQVRTAGAHDQMAFEQYLSQDVARSSCIAQWPSAPSAPPNTENEYGSCAGNFASINSHCTASGSDAVLLCVGWPTVSDSKCRGAVYVWSGGAVTRKEYVSSSSAIQNYAVLTSGHGASTSQVAFSYPSSGSPTIALTLADPPSGRYTSELSQQWVTSGTVTVTPVATGLTNPTTTTFALRPAVLDPAGPAAAALNSGSLMC